MRRAPSAPPNGVVRLIGDDGLAPPQRFRVDAATGEPLNPFSITTFDDSPAGEVYVDEAPPRGNATRDFENGVWIDPGPPVPSYVTRIGLIRALGNDWPTVRAAIKANDLLDDLWTAATKISSTDPMIAQISGALGYDEDRTRAVLIQAGSLDPVI